MSAIRLLTRGFRSEYHGHVPSCWCLCRVRPLQFAICRWVPIRLVGKRTGSTLRARSGAVAKCFTNPLTRVPDSSWMTRNPEVTDGSPTTHSETAIVCVSWYNAAGTSHWSRGICVQNGRASFRMIRVVGYGLSAVAAWAFYLTWIAIEFAGPGSLPNRLFAALFVCLFGGFSAAVVAMALPWMLAVWIYRKTRFSGAAYFTCLGALLMFLVGCAASS